MTEKEFTNCVERSNQRLFLIALSFTKSKDDAEVKIEAPDDAKSIEIEQEGDIQNNEDTSEFENEDGKVVTYSID